MRRCNAINCELVARCSDHSISFSNELGRLKKQTYKQTKLTITQMNPTLSVFIVIANLQLHKWIDINKTEKFLVIDLYIRHIRLVGFCRNSNTTINKRVMHLLDHRQRSNKCTVN